LEKKEGSKEKKMSEAKNSEKKTCTLIIVKLSSPRAKNITEREDDEKKRNSLWGKLKTREGKRGFPRKGREVQPTEGKRLHRQTREEGKVTRE